MANIESNRTLEAAPIGHDVMHGTPKLALRAGAVLGALLALASAASLVVGFLGIAEGSAARGVYWAIILGAVSAYAGVTAVLTGLGKFRTGPALAMLIAGLAALSIVRRRRVTGESSSS